MPTVLLFLSRALFIFLPIAYSVSACNTNAGRSFVPDLPGYAEENKEVIVLPKKLLEISGHHYFDDGTIAAINDEKGELYFVDLARPEDIVQEYEFGKKNDYEDLVTIDSSYYILESNGDLHYIHRVNTDSVVQYKFSRDVKVEFESLVHYPDKNALVLITKEHRFPEESVLAFAFDLETKTYSDTPFFRIPLQEIYVKMKDLTGQFKPSAAAIHPSLNKLFIIASVGKVLVQCDLNGRSEKVYKLNPSRFQQPEGISFASNGDMYISNEGLEGKATIIRFPYTGTQ